MPVNYENLALIFISWAHMVWSCLMNVFILLSYLSLQVDYHDAAQVFNNKLNLVNKESSQK